MSNLREMTKAQLVNKAVKRLKKNGKLSAESDQRRELENMEFEELVELLEKESA